MTTTVGSTGRRPGDVALALADGVGHQRGQCRQHTRSAGVAAPRDRGRDSGVSTLWPTAVMWATIAIGFIYDALGNPGAFYTVATGLGVYSVAAAGRRWTAVTGVLVAFGPTGTGPGRS